MRLGVAAVLAALLTGSCASGGGVAPAPSPVNPPAEASGAALDPYYGSYRTDDGDVIVIARMGWYFDTRDSAYRTIYATTAPGRFTIGPRFLDPLPKFADLVLDGSTLRISAASSTRVARRVANRQTDVTIRAEGADLAGTITEPPGAGPFPGIVIIHGSEPGQRYFYDVWVGVYTSLGLAVLTYDKRGNGSSTGKYPGEFPTDQALTVYADDAAAALTFLKARPEIDPKRVGFHGGSQGGWTVPLAIHRHGGAAFAVLVSAPATTVDQTDEWKGFTDGGAVAPTQSNDEMLAAARSINSGYDPAPALRAMSIPVLWLLGTNDRTVPTALCVEILTAMNKPNFTIQMLPTGHGLLVNPTGLNIDDARSPGLAPQLVPAITAWMGSHVLT